MATRAVDGGLRPDQAVAGGIRAARRHDSPRWRAPATMAQRGPDRPAGSAADIVVAPCEFRRHGGLAHGGGDRRARGALQCRLETELPARQSAAFPACRAGKPWKPGEPVRLVARDDWGPGLAGYPSLDAGLRGPQSRVRRALHDALAARSESA